MKKRLLFLSLGPFYYPDQIPLQEKYRVLSERYSGDIFAILNDRRYNGASLSDFRLHGLYLPTPVRHRTWLRDLLFAGFAVIRATYLHYRHGRFDAVIAPEPLVSGMVALLIRALTGAKVIVEVNGQFEVAFNFDRANPDGKARLRKRYVEAVLPFVLSRADAVKLLYPQQLRAFKFKAPLRHVEAFGDFVPIGHFTPADGSEKFILFVGYPWLLKGVDVLISAFNMISPEFTDWTLRVIGYCPDKSFFVSLAGGNPHIQLRDPAPYEEIINLMGRCGLLVLPSRTEAMGRVLLEAMASRKAIVASDVDGIPSVITHEQNGLLFRSENVAELAERMKRLMSDRTYAERLAANGYERVHREFSEQRYAERFAQMIEAVSVS